MFKKIKYIILILISLAIFWAYILSRNIFYVEIKEVFKILYDSTFICAVLYLCFAGLKFVSYEGVFDSIVYGFKKLVRMFKPGKYEKMEEFGDYVIRNKERKKKGIPFDLWIGLSYGFLCIIFMIIYYNIK